MCGFRKHGLEPGLTQLEVEIRSSVKHTLTVTKVREWRRRGPCRSKSFYRNCAPAHQNYESRLGAQAIEFGASFDETEHLVSIFVSCLQTQQRAFFVPKTGVDEREAVRRHI